MNSTILMGHGSGGLMTSALIRDVFVRYFENPWLNAMGDSAILPLDKTMMAMTTDSFVVDPVFFPGGNIGKLAVCGTVNDLTVAGAIPRYLSSAFILEEGFPIADLEIIVKSMAEEAAVAGISIVTGDTKVVKKGQCDKLFINTTGVGMENSGYSDLSGGKRIRPGDQIIVNGYLGDHEIAILAAREQLQFERPVLSDVASLNTLLQPLMAEHVDIHFMRDVTRGGLATVLAEVAGMIHAGIAIDENKIPIREEIIGLCEIYGFNPLYLANEGKVMMIVASDAADKALHMLHRHPLGKDACIIGSVTSENPNKVLLRSVIGGTRIIDKLAGEQLPRIC